MTQKRLLILCPYPEAHAPSQRLKYEQYFPAFRAAGWQVTVKPFMNVPFWNIAFKKGRLPLKIYHTVLAYFRRLLVLATIPRYTVVYIHLWCTPFGPPLYEWLACHLSGKMIYDIDDLVFLKEGDQGNNLAALLKGRNKPIFLMRHAQHVITCTPYLDAFVRKYNSHTTDISSTINTNTYLPVDTYDNDHVLTLGWSGSHSTVKYLRLLKDILLELRKQVRFRLMVVGDASFEMEGIEVEASAWSEDIEIPSLRSMDIGLYPLPLNEEWVLGKSGLKALQYMAVGIPVVAAGVGCNDRVVEEGETGFLVSAPEEWIEKLLLLCRDPALRMRMGKAGRKRVEERFSVRANTGSYISILDNS